MTDVVEKDVREIKYKVDAIEKSVDLLVRANRKGIVEDLLAFFGKSTDRIRVFLAVDGERTVSEIAGHLSLRNEHVSRRLTELDRAGLVRVRTTRGSVKIYEKTEKVELLGLERPLEKILNQSPTGVVAQTPVVEEHDEQPIPDQKPD